MIYELFQNLLSFTTAALTDCVLAWRHLTNYLKVCKVNTQAGLFSFQLSRISAAAVSRVGLNIRAAGGAAMEARWYHLVLLGSKVCQTCVHFKKELLPLKGQNY